MGSVLATSSVPTYLYDADTWTIVEANAAAADFYGYRLADFLTLTVDQLIQPDSRAEARTVTASGQNSARVVSHRGADGTRIDCWLRAHTVTAGGRNLRCVQVEDLEHLMSARMFVQQQVRTIVRTIGGVLRLRDPYTDRHQLRVADFVTRIARELGLTHDEQLGVVAGARIHDIGKIAVPSEILTYPGRLTETAMAILRSHSQVGYDLLSGLDLPWSLDAVVLQHHERLDGSGYPAGLHADDILPAARIIAVADVAEAMTSHRPYRPALPVSVAIEELEAGAGTRYDPDVVRPALRIMRRPEFRLRPEPFGFDVAARP